MPEIDHVPDQSSADTFGELFRAVYLSFHRRDGPRSTLAGASRAVLEHFAMTGPLTVGEASQHLRRSQSVMSEIVNHLQADGLLEREVDPTDRRRVLIWLTAIGHETLRRDHEVLDRELLRGAFAHLAPGDTDRLIAGLRALVEANEKSTATSRHRLAVSHHNGEQNHRQTNENEGADR